MANPENIINSLRQRCTQVLETCQRDLPALVQDKGDFIAEEGVAFFTDWFATAVTDITFTDLADAVGAAETLLAAFEAARAKLQVVRIR